MSFLLNAFFICVPLFVIGFTLNDRYIAISYTIAPLWVTLWTLSAPRNVLNLFVFHGRLPLFAWLGFVSACIIGLASSNHYSDQLLARASAQLLGISVMLIAAISIGVTLGREPGKLLRVVRTTYIWAGVLSALGVAQFVINNATQAQTLNFEFLNLFGAEAWRTPGEIGPIFRAGSVATEPAHFARFLGMYLGLALLHLGFGGRALRHATEDYLPLWATIAIVAALACTLSFVGVLLAAVCLLCTLILTRRLQFSTAIAIGVITVVGFLGINALGAGNWDEFVVKIQSIGIIFADEYSSSDIETQQVSALAVASNRYVAEANFVANPILGAGIGAHPLTYEQLLPLSVARLLEGAGILGLNSEDASGLFLRLMSETGLVGMVLMTVILTAPAIKLLRFVWADLRTPSSGVSAVQSSLYLGVLTSYLGVLTIAFVRYGAYFDPALWAQLALTLAASGALAWHPRLHTEGRRQMSPLTSQAGIWAANSERARGMIRPRSGL